MTIEHSDIGVGELHEPKGISTANLDTVYVADGVGSGDWISIAEATGSAAAGATIVADGSGGGEFIRWQGWGQYQDTERTVTTPTQTIADGSRTKFSCDGGNSIIERLPTDAVAPLWNTGTNKITPIAAFDTYDIRITFTAEDYAGTDAYIELELDIGGSIGVIYANTVTLRKGGAAQNLSFVVPVYSGSTFLANGCDIYVTYNGTGTCKLFKNDVYIRRESKDFL